MRANYWLLSAVTTLVGGLLLLPAIAEDEPGKRRGGENDPTTPAASSKQTGDASKAPDAGDIEVEANTAERRAPGESPRARARDRDKAEGQPKPNQKAEAQRKPDRRRNRDSADHGGDPADARHADRGETAVDAKYGFKVDARRGRLMLSNVESGGVFAQAGLRADDEIIAVNGQRVSGQDEFYEQLRMGADRRQATTVTVFRDDRMQTIKADLSQSSASLSDRATSPSPDAEREIRAYRGAVNRPVQKATQPAQKSRSTQKAHQKPAQKATQKATQKSSY